MKQRQISQRENLIALRYASGQTYKEIASALYISPATVRNHMANVYRKLGVNNKPALLLALSDTGFTDSVTRLIDNQNLQPMAGASIAVMPFKNSGKPSLDYLADGIAQSIHNYLTRHHDLFVSGRSSCKVLDNIDAHPKEISKKLGVQYVARGDVCIEDDEICLAMELIDGRTGTVLWTERFDRPLGTIQVIKCDVAQQIAATLSLQITESQFEIQKFLSGNQLIAYDWRLRGQRNLESGGLENLDKATNEFEQALKYEPVSAAAYAGLSMCYGYKCDQLLTDNYDECLSRHLSFAQKSIELDSSDSRGHYAMGCALSMSGEMEKADLHSTKAVELNPSEYHNLCARGYTLMALGNARDCLACFKKSLRRNTLAPSSCLLALGLLEYLQGNYSQAAYCFSRMSPNYIQRDCSLAATYGQLGYDEIARVTANEFDSGFGDRPSYPAGMESAEWQLFWSRVYSYLHGEDLKHMLDGLKKAGLPT